MILAPTRWKLKKAIRVLIQTFNDLNLEKQPDKTLIGRIERGFDFLGYHFEPQGFGVAAKTIENFKACCARLYERDPEMLLAALGRYARQWLSWVKGGLGVFGPMDRQRIVTCMTSILLT